MANHGTVGSPDCCLCGKPIKSAECSHPWNKSFQQWPESMMRQIHQAIFPGTSR